jgi:hypothetical protein
VGEKRLVLVDLEEVTRAMFHDQDARLLCCVTHKFSLYPRLELSRKSWSSRIICRRDS